MTKAHGARNMSEDCQQLYQWKGNYCHIIHRLNQSHTYCDHVYRIKVGMGEFRLMKVVI
jgi:ABC-type hemin transport system ATPase subunit